MADAEITEDTLLGGRIKVRQPARGYRVNVDTLLLAATLPDAVIASNDTRVVEPCCGVAAALMAVATAHKREGRVEFVGIERDAGYAELARQNVELNQQGHRTRIVEGDALDPRADFGTFDYVFFNPPYDAPGEGREPSAEKRDSFVSKHPVGDWIKVWANRMRSHSTMTLIHRAHRLGEILDALDGRLGGIEVFPIFPAAKAKARRVIVRARKGSRGPLKLFEGLVLHPDDRDKSKYTPEADAIFRGESFIWFG